MMYKSTKLFVTVAFLLLPMCVFAQRTQYDKEEQKKLDEAIDKQVEHYTEFLDLEDWQSFYVDSILRHDMYALRDEVMDLSDAKVSNPDLYFVAQDKWHEKIYNSFRKVLDDEQWAKYLKAGAEREKKARDKRAAKRK